jgi:hypothetical protein
MANEFIIKNGYFSQGNSNITGSLTVTGGITASLLGTASWSTNAITASNALTASYVNPLTQNVIVTGSLTVTNDFTVLGSASIVYITSSQLNIADNIITVNTITPSIRFGGLAVADSGSSPIQSGSMLFDSQENQWIFVHQGTGGVVTSSLLLMAAETYNNIGGETHPTTNRVMKSLNDEHIGDSNITDTGTVVSINSNTEITGSLGVTGGVTASLQGTASYATTALTASNALTASYVNPLTQDVIITGSLNVTNNITGSGLLITGSTSTDLVRITQTGTGNAFVVEDTNTPDSSQFVIDNVGNVGIGTTTPNSKLEVNGNTTIVATSGTGLQVTNFTTSSGTGINGRASADQTTGTSVGIHGEALFGLLAIGVKGEVYGEAEGGAITTGIGGYFDGYGSGFAQYPYSVQLIDGTQGTGKVLVSQTADGKANWSTQLSGSYQITGSLTVTGSTNLIGGVNVHDKYYFVNSLQDLPAPVGNTIVLGDNLTYFFTTTVDLNGNRLVCGQNTTILGASSENSRIKSTGLTGQPLISSSYSIPMRGITIEADIALELKASGSTQALDWFGVNFTNCPTVGVIKDYSNVIMTDCAFLESANCTFDGTINTVGFVTCLFNGRSGQTIMSVSPTGSIARRFRPIYSSFIALAGETALNVPTGSIANAEGYILDTCNFSGGGTYLSGSNTGSLKSLFVNNIGITNTTNTGHYYMINNTTNTTIGIPNVNVYVKAAGTTTIGVGNSPKWVGNGSNRTDYSGSIAQDFKFSAVGTVQTSATNQVISVAMAKNGVVQTETEVTVRTAVSNQPYPFAIQDLTPIAFGDYVEVFVANTNSTDVRVGDLNVIIDKIGS